MANSAASNLTLAPFSEKDVTDAARKALHAVGGHVSCAFVFASADYRPHLPDFLDILQVHGHVPLLVGCSASTLVGRSLEAEAQSGFSLLLLHLPESTLHCHTLSADHVAQGKTDPHVWQRLTGVSPDEVDAWIMLADPITFPVEDCLASWNRAYPGIPTIGGAASGGSNARDIFLLRDDQAVEGAVVLGFKGGVRIQTIVSQGCRPIGEPLPITGADRHFVLSLGSRPAYEVLQETFNALPAADKALARGNLLAGLAMSEYVDEFKTGDFLVRGLLGGDPEHGAIAIAAHPRIGQTLQFQLRDHKSADAELRHLAQEKAAAGLQPLASLLFACNGRGTDLFGSPSHDAELLQSLLGSHPGAGLFCNGEIGPVGEKTFVHGYTASVALFA